MARHGESRRARIAQNEPSIAADLPEVVIDPPDRTFSETANLDLGDRPHRAALPGPRPHGPRCGHRRAGDGRPVRRRPAGERRGPLVRRRLSARLAGDRLSRRGAGPVGGRAGPWRPRRPGLRRFAGDGDRGAGDAGPARPCRRDDPRRRRRRRRRSPSIRPRTSGGPLERALEQLRGELD